MLLYAVYVCYGQVSTSKHVEQTQNQNQKYFNNPRGKLFFTISLLNHTHLEHYSSQLLKVHPHIVSMSSVLSLLMPWSRSGKRSSSIPSANSSEACLWMPWPVWCTGPLQAHRAIHSMICYNTNLASGISLSFKFFTLNFSVILAPAFIGFMVLVAFDRCWLLICS